MKRQTDETQQSRVYSYGARKCEPLIHEALALFQLRLANRLWNVLVAIDRARLERYKRIMRDDRAARIEQIGLEITALRDEIKARRKMGRKRSVDLGELPDQITLLKQERAQLIEESKAQRDVRHGEQREFLQALQERTNHRVKRARQAAAALGLFWGTYNDVIQRADAARKLGKLQFHRFDGSGTLTAQIMGGMPVTAIGTHTFFQIGPKTTSSILQEGESFRERPWAYARLRIGSNEDRSPVWLEIPIRLHRPLPAAATIKSVSATRRVFGQSVRWQVNLTVNLPKPELRDGPAIALDIGWRLLPAGVRVAYWQDENGEHGEVLVPTRDIALFDRVRSLRSICDRNRDEFLPALAAWLDGQSLSEAWAQRSHALIQWRSSDRLARLIEWWRENRLERDQEMFQAAQDWRKQYLHLSNWWRNEQEQITLRIREQYRRFAAHIARTYGVLVLEDFDLREVARLPQPEEAGAATSSSVYRQRVAPSVLRECLRNACRREGVAVIEVPAQFSTRQCHKCHHRGEWDQIQDLKHRCESCLELWDQDRNAAINLLNLWQAQTAPAAVA